MERPNSRLTIRGLMIAVVIAAVILALPPGWRELAAASTAAVVSCLASRRLLARGDGRLAGTCFWTVSITANVVFAALSVVPDGMLPALLGLAWFFLLLPPLAGSGIIWINQASLAAGGSRRLSPWVWVFALTALPLVTVATLWPFRPAFLAAGPVLDRLADRVAAGQVVAYPVWAGPFRIAGSAVDFPSGNVALMIDPNPNGPSAFVRQGANPVLFGCHTPVRGDWVVS